MERTEELAFEIDELFSLMQRLSEEKRQVLTLRLRGEDFAMIAAKLDLSVDHVKMVIRSGIADLHKMQQVAYRSR